MSTHYSEPEPMPEEVDVPDGERDVSQDPDWTPEAD